MQTIDELRDLVRSWDGGYLARTNFTNGCFDLLHVGHLPVLRAGCEWDGRMAKARLVVAIDSDRRCAFLKGYDRPIIPAVERAELLLSTRFVSAVVQFDSTEQLREILTVVRPHFLVRGLGGKLPPQPEPFGAELARQVLWVETPDVHTSGIVERIRASGDQ